MAAFEDGRAMDRLKDVVRAVRRVYYPVQDSVIRIFAKLARRGNFVREHIAGDDPLAESRRAAVYVHFDTEGTVHDYVVHQLCELVGAGYRITFVSNAPCLPAESRARLVPLCKDAIWRFNTGYDFGAYKDGIASLDNLGRLDSLILMNDSVYGPFWSLQDTLAKIDPSATDFWGIADSFEGRYHLQTFFMVFLPTALASTAFTKFWRELPYINHKRWVIRNAEVKFTSVLERAGLRSGVLAPYSQAAETVKRAMSRNGDPSPEHQSPGWLRFRSIVTSGRVINPMHFFWDTLIEDFCCPFIKRELIQSNPARIPSASRWPEVIAAQSSYDISLIQRHLKL